MTIRLLIILVLTACGSAKETAMEKLGKKARCVSSSDELAYCTIAGASFICDKDDCVRAPSTPQVLLELDADRARAEDERSRQQQHVEPPPVTTY